MLPRVPCNVTEPAITSLCRGKKPPHPGTKVLGGLSRTHPKAMKPIPMTKLPNEKIFNSRLNRPLTYP